MPLYVRAGTILPLDPVRQYTAEPTAEPTTIRIYTGKNGEFRMYYCGSQRCVDAGTYKGVARDPKQPEKSDQRHTRITAIQPYRPSRAYKQGGRRIAVIERPRRHPRSGGYSRI
jgi:alpha-glucosidase (family GH31 glycosyl hydrolase)